MRRGLLGVAVLMVVLISAFPAGAQEWRYVAVLTSDAERGETMISVKVMESVVAGREIIIEDRLGESRDTYTVRHVYDGMNILLEQKLRRNFAAGARLFQ